MLNKYVRSTIIVLVQFFLPVVFLLLLAPQLLQFSSELNQAQDFFVSHKTEFLLAHIIFYLAIFWSWPSLIKLIITRLNSVPDTNRLKIAIAARWYLITVMALLELLTWWK